MGCRPGTGEEEVTDMDMMISTATTTTTTTTTIPGSFCCCYYYSPGMAIIINTSNLPPPSHLSICFLFFVPPFITLFLLLPLQGPEMKDALWAGLTDSLAGMPMGITAENLAAKYKISREEVDRIAIRSQTNYFKAKEAGIFKSES